MERLNVTKSNEKLKKLIAENPDLPLVMCVSEDANAGDYAWTFAESVVFTIGEFLDCQAECNTEKAYTDRDELEEDLADYYANSEQYEKLNADEYEAVIKVKAAEYDEYWTECIFVWIG